MILPIWVSIYWMIASALVFILLIKGLRFGLIQSGASPVLVRKTLLTCACVIIAWYALCTVLAINHVFEASKESLSPTIPIAVTLPIIAGVLLFKRTQALSSAIASIPSSWLVGVQFYRVIGIVFLFFYWQGWLSKEFAFPAGMGDVAVGLLAAPVALALHRKRCTAILLAITWNILGIADFLIAMTIGFLTTSGPLQIWNMDTPNDVISMYPLVMIPIYTIPSSIGLHLLSIWKIRSLMKNGKDGITG